MPKYGIYAKAVELLCFKPALARLAAFASSEKGKAALNSFPAFAIWTNATVETTVACFTAQKTLARGDDCCDFHLTRIKLF